MSGMGNSGMMGQNQQGIGNMSSMAGSGPTGMMPSSGSGCV
jgi:hypothetical protein